MFFGLFKKNLIYWKRNLIVSLIEIILPLSIIVAMCFYKRSIVVNKRSQTDYPVIKLMTNKTATDAEALYFKNCNADNPTGGQVVLSPKNDITTEVAIQLGYLGYDTVFYDSS